MRAKQVLNKCNCDDCNCDDCNCDEIAVKEDAVGGVSAPMATVANVPGVGSAVPAGGAMNTDGAAGSGDNWGNEMGVYTQDGKVKTKKELEKEAKKGALKETNLNPYDKIGELIAKKMGVPQTFKKKDSRTNTVKQETFEEMEEPVFSLPTLDQYQKASQHVPDHPLTSVKKKKVNEGETPREEDSLKDIKSKNELKDLGIPFIYKEAPSGKHRVYIKGDINDVVENLKDLGWEEVGKNPENTIKKFQSEGKELAIYADGKDLPRVTLKNIEETAEDVIESIIAKKYVSGSIEPYI